MYNYLNLIFHRYSPDSKKEIHFPIQYSNKSRGYEVGAMTLYLFYLLDVGSADMQYVKYAIERKGNEDAFYKEGKECRQAMEKLMGFTFTEKHEKNFLTQINTNFKSMLHQAAQPYLANDLSTITNLLQWSKQLLSLLKDVHKDKLIRFELLSCFIAMFFCLINNQYPTEAVLNLTWLIKGLFRL